MYICFSPKEYCGKRSQSTPDAKEDISAVITADSKVKFPHNARASSFSHGNTGGTHALPKLTGIAEDPFNFNHVYDIIDSDDEIYY